MHSSFIISTVYVVIALGLINVWIVRFGRATRYRGGGAQTMKQEFAAYGLPSWSVYIVGALKLTIATILLLTAVISSVVSVLATGALMLLGVLMMGALSMHAKVKDSVIKFLPACTMLALTFLALYLG